MGGEDTDMETARLLDEGDDPEYAEGEWPDGEPDDEDDEGRFGMLSEQPSRNPNAA
jgi:hypothetical protein